MSKVTLTVGGVKSYFFSRFSKGVAASGAGIRKENKKNGGAFVQNAMTLRSMGNEMTYKITIQHDELGFAVGEPDL